VLLAGVSYPARFSRFGRATSAAYQPALEKIADFNINRNIVSCPGSSWAAVVFPDLPVVEATRALADAIFAASRVNNDDPVAAWAAHRQLAERSTWLNEERLPFPLVCVDCLMRKLLSGLKTVTCIRGFYGRRRPIPFVSWPVFLRTAGWNFAITVHRLLSGFPLIHPLSPERPALSQEWLNSAVIVAMGSSVPVVSDFWTLLDTESLLVGFALDDDCVHSPNEKYDVSSFHKGQRSWTRILSVRAVLNVIRQHMIRKRAPAFFGSLLQMKG